MLDVTIQSIIIIYLSLVQSILNFGIEFWHSIDTSHISILKRTTNNRLIKYILNNSDVKNPDLRISESEFKKFELSG